MADLNPPQLSEERTQLTRGAYATLASIPTEHLAANGESIRSKIFRIVVALLRAPNSDDDWINMVQDWWNLFSAVNFVQLAPQTMLLDSGGASPVP